MGLQTERKNGPAILTAGEVFAGGTAIELLRDPCSPEKLALVLCREGILETKPEMTHAGRAYAPIFVGPSLSRAVRFPTRVAPLESTRKLFTDVHVFLRSHLGQLDSCITAMVFTAFASWLSPVLQMAPILSIFAPSGSPKNLALQLLALICRRPLCLAGVKRHELLRLPMLLRPTLLLDEPDLQPAMQSILQAGMHRGWYVPSGKGVRHLFGPKIICSRKLPLGTEFEAPALRLALIPVSGQLPPLDKKAPEDIAEAFQARFLGYFLRNFSKVQVPNFDVSNLVLPVQGLAQAFGASVVGDEELQAKILPLLKVHDEEIRSDRASAFDSIVIEVILFFIHKGSTTIRMGEIAEHVSAIQKGRGIDQGPSPERVGWAVKRSGIPSGRINRACNGIELTASTCRLTHKLAQSHGVRALQGELPSDCRYCSERRR